MIGIYQIKNKINGMVYIGQSIDIRRRWQEERNRKQVNPHLRRAFDKYGLDAFAFTVLCECEYSELNELEKFIIAEKGSYIKTQGYNKTFGGEGGRWTSDRRREKAKNMMGCKNPFYGRTHSDSFKQRASEQRRGVNHPSYGMKRSAETVRKLSETKIGALNPMAKKIIQRTLSGEFVAHFDSAADASREIGLSKSAIRNCACGISKSSGGFLWKYIN